VSAQNLSEAFVRVCELGLALRIPPLNTLPGCWEHRLDERWWFAANGHGKPLTCHSETGMAKSGYEVQPFTCYVEYNGWCAGIFGPYGGEFAAGLEANEEVFIGALIAATERAKAVA